MVNNRMMKHQHQKISLSVYSLLLCLCLISIPVASAYALDEYMNDEEMLPLRWKNLGEGNTYRFQMAQDRNFTRIIEDRMTSQPFIIIPRPPMSSTYYVRIKPFSPDGREGNFLPTQSILVQSDLPPPRILYPPEIKELRFINDLIVRWTHVKGATGYHMVVATDRLFREILLDIPHVSGTSYTLTDLGYGTYFLKICSIEKTMWKALFLPAAPLFSCPTNSFPSENLTRSQPFPLTVLVQGSGLNIWHSMSNVET